MLAACMLLLGCCCAVPADLIVSTDMDLSQAGIQSHRDAMLGEEFDVGLVLTLTGNTSMSSYGFSVRFNTDVLDFLSTIETLPPGMIKLATGDKPILKDPAGTGDSILGPGAYGDINRYYAAATGNGPTAEAQFVVGTITFKAVSMTDPQWQTQIQPGILEAGFDDFYDNDANQLIPIFQGGGVSVVPEPSTLVLFGTALMAGLGLLYARRRRSV
jgi:hypothetical protein